MLDKNTYKKELVRMWDSLRTNCKGLNNCNCVNCEKCPLSELEGCQYIGNDFERIEIVERWSKEHPKKYKISKLEYDILRTAIDYGSDEVFYDSYMLSELFEKGYFNGATGETYISEYFEKCEVDGNDR